MLLFALLIVACPSLFGCAEGYFNLAPDSRLPRWFTLPEGLTRDKVTLNETEYIDHSVFTLYEGTGYPPQGPLLWSHKLAQVTAERQGATSLTEKTNENGGFDGNSYPLYEVMTANGIAELLEYKRMEPVFYISDDSEIRARLDLVSTSK
ncbi:hypothetical protein [Candidatus Binatus sp.]|uniref:hypothetical protein n=1 Tax=Candidatus Binatus sp. TaxID=2811406 RepID=UPI003BAFF732